MFVCLWSLIESFTWAHLNVSRWLNVHVHFSSVKMAVKSYCLSAALTWRANTIMHTCQLMYGLFQHKRKICGRLLIDSHAGSCHNTHTMNGGLWLSAGSQGSYYDYTCMDQALHPNHELNLWSVVNAWSLRDATSATLAHRCTSRWWPCLLHT